MAILDPYLNHLREWRDQKISQADMRRRLKEQYGEDVKAQTLSDFMKKLETPGPVNGNGAAHIIEPPDASVIETVMLQASLAEITERLVQSLSAFEAMRREAGERHTALLSALQEGLAAQGGASMGDVNAALQQHTATLHLLLRQFKGEVLFRVWAKAVLITSVVWVALFALFSGYLRS